VYLSKSRYVKDTITTRKEFDARAQVLLLPYPILGLTPSDPHTAFAESLTQLALDVIHQPLSFLNVPYLLEVINQSDSVAKSQWLIRSYFDDTDAEPLVRALVTVLSKTKRDEDRVLFVLLIKTVANWWKSKKTIWEKLCEIIDPLAKDDDEAVRVLSISMTGEWRRHLKSCLACNLCISNIPMGTISCTLN